MSRIRITTAFLPLLLGIWFGQVEACVIDSVNATDSPAPVDYNTATDVGWYYTPSFWLRLERLEARHSPCGRAPT
jgi:hypothetical protein